MGDSRACRAARRIRASSSRPLVGAYVLVPELYVLFYPEPVAVGPQAVDEGVRASHPRVELLGGIRVYALQYSFLRPHPHALLAFVTSLVKVIDDEVLDGLEGLWTILFDMRFKVAIVIVHQRGCLDLLHRKNALK